MTNKKILTIAIEVEKLDECLEIYNLIEILTCGNRSISGKIDSEPLNYYKNNAKNYYFSNNSTAVVNYSLHVLQANTILVFLSQFLI